MTYIAQAVLDYVSRLEEVGLLTSRPLRLDGFTSNEIGELLAPLVSIIKPGRVRILGGVNNEADSLVNAERATRYRNQIDAGGVPFVLLVPQGQTVESSLDEPAFYVVPRSAVFQAALASLRIALRLSRAEVEGIREAAIFRQHEAIFAFIKSWDPASGHVQAAASADHLGLLGDSDLEGDLSTIRARLRRNATATAALLRPGQSPGRVLEELANVVGLDLEQGASAVLELLQWWRGGRSGASPPAADFGTWPLEPTINPEIRWEPDLALRPHKGWTDADGRVEVESVNGSATVEWIPVRVTPETKFEVELIEDTTQQVLKRLGVTKRSKKTIKWSTIFKGDEIREELQELNPSGDVEDYALRLRLKMFEGKRWVQEFESKEFYLKLPNQGDDVVAGATPTASHALYRFHADGRAIAPTIEAAVDEGHRRTSVRLLSEEGRARETSLDVSRAMREIEDWILARPDETGPWMWESSDNGDAAISIGEPSPVRLGPTDSDFFEARRRFFALTHGNVIESLDLGQPALREAAEAYVHEYGRAVDAIAEFAATNGALADADRLRAAALASIDAVEVVLPGRDGETPYSVLMIPPTHPTVVAWLLTLRDLLWRWSRGKFDPGAKPPYRGLVEGLAAGPRSMITGTTTAGRLEWWAFAGNVTATWQAFVPVDASRGVRWRDWEGELLDALALPGRAVGSGRLDARRIGSRLKKYAVLHPYMNQLKVAAVMAGDGRELLDALKVIDERPNLPAGALSVRQIRYQLSIIGPASSQLGRSIDELTLSPGEDKWRRYADAILDNPETVLSPGFAYARRPIRTDHRDASSIWHGLSGELDRLDAEGGVHVLIIGPMLSTSVGAAPVDDLCVSLQAEGLICRPVIRHVAAAGDNAFEGNWLLLACAKGGSQSSTVEASTAHLATALNLAYGLIGNREQAGLQVALAGPVSANLRRAHDVADWVIIADPLFAINLMDQRQQVEGQALLLDYSPEFEPYPGGRVVVTTNSLREVEAIANAVRRPLATSRAITGVLASVSARLLLSLANPTKQVVGGLTGLALTRVWLRHRQPDALVLPIDGHEDMFVIPRTGRGGRLADLLAVSLVDGRLAFNVVESKWVGRANLDAKVMEGAQQARTSVEVIRSEYLEYDGVDRNVRLENLLDVVVFHLDRSNRHQVPASFDGRLIRDAFRDDNAVREANVDGAVVVWCPDDSMGSTELAEQDGVRVVIHGQNSIDEYADKMGSWPGVAVWETAEAPPSRSKPDEETHQVIEGIGNETIADDLAERMDQELSGVEADTGELKVVADQAEPAVERTEGSPVKQDVARHPAGTPSDEKRPTDGGVPQDCIKLGSVVGTRAAALWCPPRLSNGHLILIGGSGAGKTTALRHITAQIRRAGVPVLVLDFHGDLLPTGAAERLYAFDYEGNASYVNPFHLDPRYGTKLTPSRLKWEFVEAWRSHYPTMGVHQVNYIAELVEQAFAAAAVTDDPASWITPVTFGNVIESFEESDAPENLKAKIRSYMKRFNEWRIFHGGSGIAIESFLDESTRLDLSQLDEIARNILADVVLRRLFLLIRAVGPVDPAAEGWAKFRAYVVIDEAQLLMGGTADAKASLTKYAAEARKFGIGLILATQLRDNVPPEIWGNIDTRLFMQALDPAERSRNAKAANVPELVLQSLARGEAILTSSSQPNQRPLSIQIEPEWLHHDDPS